MPKHLWKKCECQNISEKSVNAKTSLKKSENAKTSLKKSENAKASLNKVWECQNISEIEWECQNNSEKEWECQNISKKKSENTKTSLKKEWECQNIPEKRECEDARRWNALCSINISCRAAELLSTWNWIQLLRIPNRALNVKFWSLNVKMWIFDHILPEMYNMLAIQVIFLHCLDMILSVHVLIVILSMFVPIDGTLSHRKCKKREKICAIGWKPYFGVDVIFRPFPLSLCTSATSAAAANRFLHDYFLENWNHLKKLNQTRIMKTRTRKGFLQDFSSSKVALVKTH